MTERNPDVSVILPTRNRARSIVRAAASVLAQTHGSLELLVVDDASSDDTAALLATIDDPRMKVIRLERPGGAAAARNRGLAAASGAFAAFQDSDDAWRPHKLAVHLEAMGAAPASVIASVGSFCHHRGDAARDVVHTPGVVTGREVAQRIVNGLSLGTVSLVARRDAVARAGGFDETLPRLQDIELCLRLAALGDFVFTNAVLADVFHGADSISADATRFEEAITAVAHKHEAVFRRHARGYSYQLYRAGKYHAFESRYRTAVPLLVRSLRRHPANWRSLLMLAAIALGLAPRLARRSKER